MDELSLNLEKVYLEKDKILDKIKNINKLFKICEPPCLDEDITELIKYLKEYRINNPGIPKELRAIWKISSEWHLFKDHNNVFGFNIYSPEKIIEIENNNCIFGDESIRKKWKDDHGDNSCGNKDWVCFVSYSEYDYIYINLNKDSNLFGSTRHIVNNCNEDRHLTDVPFEKFINYLNNNIGYYIDENYIEEDINKIEDKYEKLIYNIKDILNENNIDTNLKINFLIDFNNIISKIECFNTEYDNLL